MNQQNMIDDLIRLLDEGAQNGVGHVNVACGQSAEGAPAKQVQSGCPDCSAIPLACSVPTLHQGLDRQED